ncbi:glycosyltransferase family 4 protein [Pelagicoccus sp. SDUM812003]|uniref:glycosyltransferase family 4 protein n=1 Tax=Pelagicoccus sp. SDUM812003 TaxID=3041267 RepID=UPI00280D30B7|nr:glycosyltransferase family 4 protein [Pelagicoccus sp. SDUM812003]MDQ8204661.1 glycosyltransferase family 4 protein [Pelagicoccus sp. SDUM812003]
MRILLSAFACGPGRGSEPGVGWAVATRLAKRHHVHVLTHRYNQKGIEQHLDEHGDIENLEFSYYGSPRPYYDHGIKSFTIQFYYYYWQRKIAQWAQDAILAFKPDVIQHVTLVRYWTPSSLASMGIPFIFGPVGGADATPKGFIKTLTLRGRITERVRSLAQGLSERDPAMKRTIRSAAAVVATTRSTAERARSLGAKRVSIIGESALDEGLMPASSSIKKTPDRPARFIVSARLIHWKGINLSIQAFAKCRDLDATLEIFGDGPERQNLWTLVKRLRLTDRVIFRGHVARNDYLKRLSGSIALLHPSLHDSGGWVCIEAMATGVPVVCLDAGGPATQVDQSCGYIIDPIASRYVINKMAMAMRELTTNPALHAQKSQAAKKAVRDRHTWDSKIDSFEALYERAIHPRKQEPNASTNQLEKSPTPLSL